MAPNIQFQYWPRTASKNKTIMLGRPDLWMSKYLFPIDLETSEPMVGQVIRVCTLQVYVADMTFYYEWSPLAIRAFEAILDHWHVVEFHYKRTRLILDSDDLWKSHRLPWNGFTKTSIKIMFHTCSLWSISYNLYAIRKPAWALSLEYLSHLWRR